MPNNILVTKQETDSLSDSYVAPESDIVPQSSSGALNGSSGGGQGGGEIIVDD